MSSLGGADDKVIPAVSVEVAPGYSRSQLTKLFQHERLPLEIIKGLLVMRVSDEIAHVSKDWRAVRYEPLTRCARLRNRLVQFINLIRRGRFDSAFFPAPPRNFD